MSNETPRRTIRIDNETWLAAHTKAATENTTISETIRAHLTQWAQEPHNTAQHATKPATARSMNGAERIKSNVANARVKLTEGGFTMHDGLQAVSDREKLNNAVSAVLEWCDLEQHPFHPMEGVVGFSSADWALDDAARRVRTAIAQALEVNL